VINEIDLHIELAKYLTVVEKLGFYGFGLTIQKLVNNIMQQLILVPVDSNLVVFNLNFKDGHFELYLFNE
jgi:hypothetical protein